MGEFRNVFEVRKNVRFELESNILFRDLKINSNCDDENLLKSFNESYKSFIELLLQNFCKRKNIVTEKKEVWNNIFANAFKKAWINVEENSKENKNNEEKYEYEWFKTIQFLHKWLEELFINDFIENRKEIKYDRNGKKKQHNYITFWDLWDKNFIKIFFENFFKEIDVNLKELKYFVTTWLENKSRTSDILFLVQKINSREHLWKLYTMFEKNYIQHKNDSSVIERLKISILNLKENIEKLLIELRTSQSFWIPIEHVSLNYNSINKTEKEITKDIKEVLKWNNLNKKYKWTFEKKDNLEKNEKSIIKTFNLKEKDSLKLIQDELNIEIDISEFKEKVKLFKAKQKAWFLQLLQNKVPFEDFKNSFNFEFMWENFNDFRITLFSDISKENYDEMLKLTKKIEQESDKENRKKLKMQRWKFFQFRLKKFKDFSENYKKIAQKYWRDSTEIKSLERQKIDAIKLRWWWFLSKEDNNYFINTFDVDNSKQVYKEIKNLQKDWNDIKIYTLSSITLRALDKLCFKKDSSFIKHINTRDFNERVSLDNWKSFWRLKNKTTLLEEWRLMNFYIYILENQVTLNIKYKSKNSLNILKNSKDIEEFEINLKLETYELIEKNISKQTYKNILNNYKWNSYKITSYDLEKWLETKKYTTWWFNFWKKENKNDKYIIRINPELTIFFKEKNKDFIKENSDIKKNRRLEDRFILSTNFSFHSNKSYIDSAFINDEKRKNSIETFNEIFNWKNKLDYFYWLDKWTNELITLSIFRKNWEKIEVVNISEKIPVYRITNKWLNHFEYIKDKKTWECILDEKTWEKKKRFLSKNVSYFIKDLQNKELFEKLEIKSCLWDLTYAKLIKWNIILNADIFTTLNLYKVTAKRFLNDAITKWNIESDRILYNESDKIYYYEYLNRWNKYTKVILYWKDEFDFLPYKEEKFNSLKEEVEDELNQYIKDIKLFLQNSKKYNNNENISIQKINNYKNAISANIVWIIMKLQEYFNWYICYESLDEWQILKKWLSTFIWNVVNEKIYNRLELNLEVPPILKKFRTDIWWKQIIQHGKVIYVDENNTSKACPRCNEYLLKKDKNWNLIEKKGDWEINKLWWHLMWEIWEYNMHHCDNPKNCPNIENHISKENKAKCDYHMKNNNYWFDFIKSWDDLAAYNIAKKWLEYINFINSNTTS